MSAGPLPATLLKAHHNSLSNKDLYLFPTVFCAVGTHIAYLTSDDMQPVFG